MLTLNMEEKKNFRRQLRKKQQEKFMNTLAELQAATNAERAPKFNQNRADRVLITLVDD